MSALGKRYIAVLESVGGNSETDRFVDGEVHVEPAGANTAHEKYQYPTAHHVATIEIDIDGSLPINPEPTDEQLAMHAERMALYWAAEFDRLAPCLGGHPARESETVRMRAVIEAMRPIVEAALTWMDTRGDPPRATPAGDLRRAVVANRERLALAMSAWENSGTLTPEERLKANPSMLTPSESAGYVPAGYVPAGYVPACPRCNGGVKLVKRGGVRMLRCEMCGIENYEDHEQWEPNRSDRSVP